MGFWDFVKSIGSKVVDGAKFIGGKINDGFNAVRAIGGKIASLPVIGDAARAVAASPIGQAVLNGFNKANEVVQRGNDILQGAGGGNN